VLTGSARHGFTLVEIMLATAAMLIVGAAVHRSLLLTQRLARRQAEQLGAQTNLRGAVLAVGNELRELSTRDSGPAAANDFLSIAPAEVTYRAMRGTGVLCEPLALGQVRISRNSFTGHRMPQARRDSVFVLQDLDLGSVPFWVPLAIVGISTTTPCPGSGSPGITLTVSPNDSVTGAAAGTPVRVYEIMQLRLYESSGKSWLGMRSVSAGEGIQPLFGPLSADAGFRLEYLDRGGIPTSNPDGVKSIRVTVRADSQGVSGDEIAAQPLELSTQLVLKNALD
jgi:prepilin-type N-terminal cleavage/methylation domain-containing protein